MGGSRLPLNEPGVLERPPGWFFHLFVLAVAAYTLWSASLPYWPWRDPFGVLGWIAIALVWAVRVTVYNYRHAAREKRLVPRSRLRWSIAPAIALVAVGVSYFQVPMLARFRWSRAALERAVVEVRSSPDFYPGDSWRPQSPTRIGLYDVAYREAIADGARFLVADSLGSSVGFAYSPSGEPSSPTGEDQYEPLGDGWYLWFSSW